MFNRPIPLATFKFVVSIAVMLIYWGVLLPPMLEKYDLDMVMGLVVAFFWVGVAGYTGILFVKELTKWFDDNRELFQLVKADLIHLLIVVLMCLCLLMANVVIWKWIIPLLMSHGSSAAFDTAISIAILDIFGTMVGFIIITKSKPKKS